MNEKAKIKFIKLLLATFIFFVVYNTLIPFKMYLSPGKLLREFGLIDWTPYFHNGRFNSLTDVVGNIILFLPFGFLFYLHQTYSKKSVAILRVTIYGFLFSLGIEIAQIFFKYRITSVTDLFNNTIGAFGGAIAGKIYLAAFEERVQKYWNYILENEPISLIILLIVSVQIFSSALPFNISISVSDLKRSVAYTNILPFGMMPLGELLGVHMKKVSDLIFSWKEFFGNVLFYSMYSYLVWYAFYQYWKNQRYAVARLILFLVLFFPAIELLQFMIKSRFSDINDIISGYAGAGLGSLLFISLKDEDWFKSNREIVLRHFKAIIFIYFVYIFYKGWSPFNFTTDPQVLALSLRIRNLVPFYAYFKVTSLWNIYDIVETFFMMMPAGIILAVWGKAKHPFFIALIIGFVCGLAVEGAQIFMLTRSGEITDVLVMTAGSAAGVKFYAYFKEKIQQKKQPAQDFIHTLQEDSFNPDAVFD